MGTSLFFYLALGQFLGELKTEPYMIENLQHRVRRKGYGSGREDNK